MSVSDAQRILEQLVDRVRGAHGAILVDSEGGLIAQVCHFSGVEPKAVGDCCGILLRETQAAADRLGQGPVTEVVLETESATIAMLPLESARCLYLLLRPEAIVGRGLFEARRAAFTLDATR